MGSVVVVLGDEELEEVLEFGDGGGLEGLVTEPFLDRLLEAFDFAVGLGVAAAAVLLDDAEGGEEDFEGVAAAVDLLGGHAGGVHHAVEFLRDVKPLRVA